ANGKIDFTVSGEYHRQEAALLHGNVFALSFSAPIPFFNRNQGDIARARVQQTQAEAKVRALEAEIQSEVGGAFAAYAAARDSATMVEEQMLDRARRVRATTEYAYRAGEASLIELLDAVRAFNDTMHTYNDARADSARNLNTLDAMIGKVIP